MECRICKTIIDNELSFCPQCGLEFAVIPESASEELKRHFGEREHRCRESFEALQAARAEIDALRISAKEAEQVLRDADDKARRRNQRERFFLITKNDFAVLLDEGEYTFGKLGPTTDRHFVFLDKTMDARHFALLVEHDVSDTEPFRFQIKKTGAGDLRINTTTTVGNNWTNVLPGNIITAGRTEMRIVKFQKKPI